KEVAAADKERDAAYSSIKAFLNGYRKLPFAANHTDAEALYTIFKQFGLNLDTLSYSAQTAQLKKLIEELEKPENTQRIENLTITTAFNDLKQNTKLLKLFLLNKPKRMQILELLPAHRLPEKN